MITVILLGIVFVIYIVLLVMNRKKKSDSKIDRMLYLVQGILWILIAIDGWATSSIIMKVVYGVMIVMSFLAGIPTIGKDKQ